MCEQDRSNLGSFPGDDQQDRVGLQGFRISDDEQQPADSVVDGHSANVSGLRTSGGFPMRAMPPIERAA